MAHLGDYYTPAKPENTPPPGTSPCLHGSQRVLMCEKVMRLCRSWWQTLVKGLFMTRSERRRRMSLIVGGVAAVALVGVVVTGALPSGDRAGTVTTEASSEATAEESTEATSDEATTEATSEETTDVTAEETTESTSEETTDATTEETTDATTEETPEATAEAVVNCADGGDCQLGDTGPGGGIVFYVASSPFVCGTDRGSRCTYLEAGTVMDAAPLCSNNVSNLIPTDEIGWGPYNTYQTGSCSGGTLATVKGMTAGGQSDWFVPSKDEMQLAYDNRSVIGLSVGKGLAYWTSSRGSGSSTAYRLRTDINYWNANYGTASSNYVISMRSF